MTGVRSVKMNYTAQKLYEARKCPRCGSPLCPPWTDQDGDLICGHCQLNIKWIREWIAIIPDGDDFKQSDTV